MPKSLEEEVKAFRGGVLGYTVFQRTYSASLDAGGEGENEEEKKSEPGLSEGLQDCIDRMLSSDLVQNHCCFSPQDENLLRTMLLEQRCCLSGRSLQCLGVRDGLGLLPLTSCAYVEVASPIEPFLFVARLSLQGVGVGYSVQKQFIDKLPNVVATPLRVESVADSAKADCVVNLDEPSRESWVQLVSCILGGYFNLTSYEDNNVFTYSLVGNNSALASGLNTAVTNICSTLNARAGTSLRSVDCMDLMNIIAPAVVTGKTRRSALLALGDASDLDFLRAKRWDLGNLPLWRSASNNSVVCSDISQLPEEFWEGYKGKGEAMGLVNLDLFRSCGRVGETKYPDPQVSGVSACAEQGLASEEVSCLAELMLPQMESPEQLWEATRLLYTICKNSFLLHVPSQHHQTTKDIVEQNFRMGLGVTGYMQASELQKSWLDANYNRLRAYDEKYSKENGLRPSIKLTTVKPSGTVSLLSGNTPGCHPGFASYFIRRVRFNADSPQLDVCRSLGLYIEEERGWGAAKTTGKYVVEFPSCLPKGTKLAEDTSAVEQLEVVRRLQSEWSDSAVSVTIYYKADELDGIQKWLLENYQDNIKAVSFMLHCDHGFDQAPYEKIEEETYHEMMEKIKRNAN